MNRVDRLLGYLITFQGHELVRAQDLAERFEVSERTVYRDIDALCELGVPLYGIAGEGYRLMEGYYLPPIMFAEAEARALFLAISILTSLTPPGPTKSAGVSALEKVRAVLPDATLAQVEALQAVVGFYTFGREPLNLDEPIFIELQRAIHSRRVVQIGYHAMRNNRVSSREVEPLYLAYVDNAWILHGYCRLRLDYRNFRLDRIDSYTVLAREFDPRSTAFPGRSEGDGVEVVIRFDEEVVRWVREAQHFTFVEERVAESRHTISYEATDHERANPVDVQIMVYQVHEQRQIVRWLLGWGDQFEILAPAGLREEMAKISSRMAARHC